MEQSDLETVTPLYLNLSVLDAEHCIAYVLCFKWYWLMFKMY